METGIHCFCTCPVEVLTEVILAGIIAYRLQILYITTVFRRLTPPPPPHFAFLKRDEYRGIFVQGRLLFPLYFLPPFPFVLTFSCVEEQLPFVLLDYRDIEIIFMGKSQ